MLENNTRLVDLSTSILQKMCSCRRGAHGWVQVPVFWKIESMDLYRLGIDKAFYKNGTHGLRDNRDMLGTAEGFCQNYLQKS